MKTDDLRSGRTSRHFVRYVAPNMLGVVGMSAYFFADTYFISQAAGADGLTALNLILPFFYFIYGLGYMLGIGAATRFTIERARGNAAVADRCLGNALCYAALIGLAFAVPGLLWSEEMLAFCGADDRIVTVGGLYLRMVLLTAWAFMGADIVSCFVRNDGAPRLSMAAMLISAFYNIVFDYVFITVCGWGMVGAALATVTAPMIGMMICLSHFFSQKNNLRFRANLSWSYLKDAAKLGVSGFMGEMSPCVVMVIYNSLFLLYAGNTGVAAYGIIANLATMAAALFNGLSQGVQPLMSFYHGCRDYRRRLVSLRLAIGTGFGFALIVIVLLNVFCSEVIAVFNRDADLLLAEYAALGIRSYFPGFIFAGYNVVVLGFFAATEVSGWAGMISFLRGFVMITVASFVLAHFWGMAGIWLSFPVAEFLTALLATYALYDVLREKNMAGTGTGQQNRGI